MKGLITKNAKKLDNRFNLLYNKPHWGKVQKSGTPVIRCSTCNTFRIATDEWLPCYLVEVDDDLPL